MEASENRRARHSWAHSPGRGATLGATARRIATGHLPMLERPVELAGLISR